MIFHPTVDSLQWTTELKEIRKKISSEKNSLSSAYSGRYVFYMHTRVVHLTTNRNCQSCFWGVSSLSPGRHSIFNSVITLMHLILETKHWEENHSELRRDLAQQESGQCNSTTTTKAKPQCPQYQQLHGSWTLQPLMNELWLWNRRWTTQQIWSEWNHCKLRKQLLFSCRLRDIRLNPRLRLVQNWKCKYV